MRRVSYESVLRKASQLTTGEASPSVDDAATLNVFINLYASKFWRDYFWPDVTPAEERQFRANYVAATTYGAPTATVPVEVYYPTSAKYYQSLVGSNVGHAPTTGTGLVENSAWWAESSESYVGNEWADATSYAVGDRVENTADRRYYQCHTAHTSSGSFDATKFGILTPFIRSIDYNQTGETAIGEVKAVWDVDPRVFELSERSQIPFDLVAGDIIVRGSEPVVWLEFRKLVPSWSGAVWSAATTYAADDQAYDSTTGDFYLSLQAANTNHAVTDTAWWSRIEFPYFLRDSVPLCAFADMLRVDEQESRARVIEGAGVGHHKSEMQLIELEQGQAGPMRVRTRPRE